MKVIWISLLLVAASTGATIERINIIAPKVLQPVPPEGRIVGGKDTNIAVHPHQISLRKKSLLGLGLSYSHSCGGSIYSENIVITAAHCVVATVPSQFQVVAGSNHRRSSDGIIVPVKEIIYHENYNKSTTDNDVAILVLGAPLPLNNFGINPIDLAKDEPEVGALATVTGWGTTSAGGIASEILQEVRVPIVSQEDCNNDYGAGRITDAMVCAGLRGVGGKDSCQGDSGGPLVIDGKLAGVVSFGRSCAEPKYPGVYAKVSYLRPWLLKKIAQIELSSKN